MAWHTRFRGVVVQGAWIREGGPLYGNGECTNSHRDSLLSAGYVGTGCVSIGMVEKLASWVAIVVAFGSLQNEGG